MGEKAKLGSRPALIPALPSPPFLAHSGFPRGQKGSELRERLQIIFYLYKKGVFSKRHTKKRVGCGPRGEPGDFLHSRGGGEEAWTKS